MSDKTKKILFWGAIVFILLVLAGFLYFFFFRSTPSQLGGGGSGSSFFGGSGGSSENFSGGTAGETKVSEPAVTTDSSPPENTSIITRIKRVFGIQSKTQTKTGESSFPGTPSEDGFTPENPPGTDPSPEGPRAEEKKYPLRKIVDVPVAGGTAFVEGAALKKEVVVRYMERATGHIYNISLASNKKEKITNTTIPRVHEAFFSGDAEFVVARYLDDDAQTIETFVGEIPKEKGGALKGEFLPRNAFDVVLSPSKTDVLYLLRDESGATGFRAPLSQPAKRTFVFSFPFSEWIPQWVRGSLVVLTTKPSAVTSGYAYVVSGTGGEPKKIFDGVFGMTILVNGAGTSALISNSSPVLSVYTLNGASLVVNSGSAKQVAFTLSEKCVWAKDDRHAYCAIPSSTPSGIYPDSWYQGSVSFSDTFWRVDTETGTSEVLVDPAALGAAIDGIKLFTSPDETYLFFTNKKDMSLWALDLSTLSE